MTTDELLTMIKEAKELGVRIYMLISTQ